MEIIEALFLSLLVFSVSLNEALEINENYSIKDRENNLNFYAHRNNDDFFSQNEKKIHSTGIGHTVFKVVKSVFGRSLKDKNIPEVHFSLSTRENPNPIGYLISIDMTSPSIFKIERPTIIIVPGYRSDGWKSWMIDMKNAFLEWKDVNVMLIDWSKRAKTWNYFKALANTENVAQAITQILTATVNSVKNPGDKKWGPIYMVGHSLGAHICGLTARHYKSGNLPWLINRITGLDPAGPGLKNSNIIPLNRNDANFVDIIHTNGNHLGLFNATGHVDFYPNGGEEQDRGSSFLQSLRNLHSHRRAHYIFTESIYEAAKNGCIFWSHRWDGTSEGASKVKSEKCDEKICAKMGILADSSPKNGIYYLETRNIEPYCILNNRRRRKAVWKNREKNPLTKIESVEFLYYLKQ